MLMILLTKSLKYFNALQAWPYDVMACEQWRHDYTHVSIEKYENYVKKVSYLKQWLRRIHFTKAC